MLRLIMIVFETIFLCDDKNEILAIIPGKWPKNWIALTFLSRSFMIVKDKES